jgi:hypothetical protein
MGAPKKKANGRYRHGTMTREAPAERAAIMATVRRARRLLDEIGEGDDCIRTS